MGTATSNLDHLPVEFSAVDFLGCLNAQWFVSFEGACEKLKAWRGPYNDARPHSEIGNIPMIMVANSTGETSLPNLSDAKKDPGGPNFEWQCLGATGSTLEWRNVGARTGWGDCAFTEAANQERLAWSAITQLVD